MALQAPPAALAAAGVQVLVHKTTHRPTLRRALDLEGVAVDPSFILSRVRSSLVDKSVQLPTAVLKADRHRRRERRILQEELQELEVQWRDEVWQPGTQSCEKK